MVLKSLSYQIYSLTMRLNMDEEAKEVLAEEQVPEVLQAFLQ